MESPSTPCSATSRYTAYRSTGPALRRHQRHRVQFRRQIERFQLRGAELFPYGGINGIGICMQPASGTVNFAITNTIVSNNPYANILYDPPTGSTASANGVIDHVVVTDSTDGSGISITPGTSSGTTLVAISNSVASNDSSGILVNGGNISIDNTALSGNTDGISALGTPKVLLGRSVIVGNTDRGIINSTSPNTFFTYQNNQINLNGNGNVVSGSTLVMLPFQ